MSTCTVEGIGQHAAGVGSSNGNGGRDDGEVVQQKMRQWCLAVVERIYQKVLIKGTQSLRSRLGCNATDMGEQAYRLLIRADPQLSLLRHHPSDDGRYTLLALVSFWVIAKWRDALLQVSVDELLLATTRHWVAPSPGSSYMQGEEAEGVEEEEEKELTFECLNERAKQFVSVEKQLLRKVGYCVQELPVQV